MFIAALFIIIKKKKKLNQARDAVAGWINKGWCIHSYRQILLSNEKELLIQHRLISDALCSVKETKLKDYNLHSETDNTIGAENLSVTARV